MNTNEREPLLSDKRIGKAQDFYDECTGPQGFESGADFVRNFYEDLITTGKLRVVEEMEVDKDGKCIKCGSYTDDGDLCETPTLYKFCPGCGNKIKR